MSIQPMHRYVNTNNSRMTAACHH